MDEFTIRLSLPAEHMQNVFGEYDNYVRKKSWGSGKPGK